MTPGGLPIEKEAIELAPLISPFLDPQNTVLQFNIAGNVSDLGGRESVVEILTKMLLKCEGRLFTFCFNFKCHTVSNFV